MTSTRHLMDFMWIVLPHLSPRDGQAASRDASGSAVDRRRIVRARLTALAPTRARVVRGRFLALREEDFVLAARLVGASEMRIILRHMVPSFLSHIIAATTLALPAIIIFETSLSFLGLGLRPPAISWGVMLQQASNVQTLAISPWLLIPAIPVILAILAFNFLGDGLRDAADPYNT